MKIGRNGPCPCGSGKKYKKCCLEKDEEINEDFSKGDYLRLKGKNAEELVQFFANRSFFVDWCYPNPKLNNGKELCDLLIVFGETVIIWQIKDLKKQADGKYSSGKVEKNLRQLLGAKRTLFDLKEKIILENPRRGKEEFDPTDIKNIYLISALVGEGEDYFSFVESIKNSQIHIFDKSFVEIILNELDTISDFTEYLHQKEKFIQSNPELIRLYGGEEELLAYYLNNQRNFDKLTDKSFITIQEGCWEQFTKNPQFLNKKREDAKSYFWDFLIDQAYLGKEQSYERIIREMAISNRFNRRMLSERFLEGREKSQSLLKTHNFFKRTSPQDGITYCFVYSKTGDRKKRLNLLLELCLATRSHYKQNKKVLGIATEMGVNRKNSFDFCLLNFEDSNWSEKEEQVAKQVIEKYNLFKDYQEYRIDEEEYPLE